LKILVLDVDDTVLHSRRTSRILWSISSIFQRPGRRVQRPDRVILEQLAQYDKVIVLTGRD
jgi:hydroxymethylpyrimidine pyrophosphatase-like HAD family hydrolase